MVLGRGSQHRRTANVDVLDAMIVRCAFRDGGLERIEIDDQKIDRSDVVLVGRRCVVSIAANLQETTVNLRVQSLEASVHHLREAGVLGNVLRGDACGLQSGRGASCRQYLDTARGQLAGKLDDTRFVGHRDEGAADARGVGSHRRHPVSLVRRAR